MLLADTTQQYDEGFHSDPNLAVAPYPGGNFLYIAVQSCVCASELLHFSVRSTLALVTCMSQQAAKAISCSDVLCRHRRPVPDRL